MGMGVPGSVEPVDRQLTALRALHSVTTALHSASDLPTILDLVAQGVVQTSGFEVCAVNVRMPDDYCEVLTVTGDHEGLQDLVGVRDTVASWEELLELSELRRTRLRFLHHSLKDEHRGTVWVPDLPATDDEDAWHPDDCLFAPLLTPAGDWLGVLSVDVPTDGRQPGDWQLEILEMFADSAAVAMANARMLEASRHAATHDALTGLANRTLLTERAAESGGAGLAVLMIDLDGFKEVNDTFGHTAGDEILVAVASRLQRAVRGDDLVARVGGDEFVVLLGEGDEPTVQAVRRRIAECLGPPISGRWGAYLVSASVGAARGRDLADLLVRADEDMYRHKQGDVLATAGRRSDVSPVSA